MLLSLFPHSSMGVGRLEIQDMGGTAIFSASITIYTTVVLNESSSIFKLWSHFIKAMVTML